MIKAHELLQGCKITSLDFNEFLSRKFDTNDLIYCDPPYYKANNSRVGPNINHNVLAELIKNLPCKVILSGYNNAIYDKVLTNFTRKNKIRASCGRNKNGQSAVATEYKWQNFR